MKINLKERALKQINENPFLNKEAREEASKSGKVFAVVHDYGEHRDCSFMWGWYKTEKSALRKLEELTHTTYYSDYDPSDTTLYNCGTGCSVVAFHVDEFAPLDSAEMWTTWAENVWINLEEWQKLYYLEDIPKDFEVSEELLETIKTIFRIGQ